LMMAYDGAWSPIFFSTKVCISFSALHCRKKKLDESSRLDVVEIARVA